MNLLSKKKDCMHCIILKNVILYTQCIKGMAEDSKMDCKTKIKELRESTGMNRKEFCDFFQIPYRTVTDWERDNRHAPDYVLKLLEYYIRMEGLNKKNDDK